MLYIIYLLGIGFFLCWGAFKTNSLFKGVIIGLCWPVVAIGYGVIALINL